MSCITIQVCIFFKGGGKAAGGIDGMFPEDEESFSKFGEALKNKITLFEVCLIF